MASPKKKPTPKKKENGNKPEGKYHEKIKIPGTFDELLNAALSTKKK